MSLPPQPRPGYSDGDLLDDADQCVKCGLCLRVCPTYGLSGSEAASPRGRLAIAQGLVEGRIAWSPGARQSLDGCLGCRACERACPSGVPYGRVLDGIRSRQPRPGPWRRLLHWAVSSGVPALPVTVHRLPRLAAWGAPGRALRRAGGWPGRLARWTAAWTPAAPPRPGTYPARGTERARVGLFLGCIGRVADGGVLHDAIRVLNGFGFTVEVPPGQGCCGAVHLHGGDPEGAASRARRNLEAFSGVDAVVGCASGCTATLAEYHDLPALPGDASGDFARKVEDVCAFLDRAGPPGSLTLHPLDGAVRVHDPCTLVNVLGARDAPYRLLGRVPGLAVAPLAGNDRCCGAAGTYLLEHPETAAALVAPKVAAAAAGDVRWLATSNVGCALHLRAGLVDRGVQVVHPVSLLAMALEPATGRPWRERPDSG